MKNMVKHGRSAIKKANPTINNVLLTLSLELSLTIIVEL